MGWFLFGRGKKEAEASKQELSSALAELSQLNATAIGGLRTRLNKIKSDAETAASTPPDVSTSPNGAARNGGGGPQPEEPPVVTRGNDERRASSPEFEAGIKV